LHHEQITNLLLFALPHALRNMSKSGEEHQLRRTPTTTKVASRADYKSAFICPSICPAEHVEERITPSVEVAAKIADALDVSLHYLVGATSFVVKDKKMLHRLELLEKIDDDRETILKLVDNYLTTAQLQTTHKKLKQKA
jgi:hypothetical protein